MKRTCAIVGSRELKLSNDPAFVRISILVAENFKIERSQSAPQTSTHGCFPLRLLQHENVGGTHTPIFVTTFWHLWSALWSS